MKKLFCLITILLLFIPVYALDFGMSFSLRSAYDDKLPFDYQFSSEITIKDRLDAEIEIERENNQQFYNYFTEVIQKGSFYAIKTQKSYLDSKNLNRIIIDARGLYSINKEKLYFILRYIANGEYSLGIRQQWENKIPNTNIVIGKSFRKELSLKVAKIVLSEIVIEYETNFYSDNFRLWYSENKGKVSVCLTSNLDFFVKYVVRENNYWRVKTGIKIKI